MFGTFRAILAIMVVALHLGGVPALGNYAVFAFFCLSGYLMTLIMQRNYGYTLIGFSTYIINRFLRIYPIYWFSIILSIILIWYSGEVSSVHFHKAIYLPKDEWDLFRNVTLFFPYRDPPRLTPPAWALTVEICFYILIGLGLAKNKLITLIWFVFSVLYHLSVTAMGLGREYYYFSILAASLPFSTGAIVFHFNKQLRVLIDKVSIVHPIFMIPVFILINWLIGIFLSASHGLFFYINFILCAVYILVLSNTKSLPYIDAKLDKWIGDFSYPMYLIHYQVGFLMVLVFSSFGVSFERPSLSLFLAAMPLIILFSWIASVLMEKPIDLIRDRIKANTCTSEPCKELLNN